ncbi:MAG: hypothetical protein JRE71_18640 [Deltaproteobacteria bacterium]|nr:hypothetical protein [Deltaproteobacteria bacterium]
MSELFFADPSFAESLDTNAAPFLDFGRCYEVCQWSPSSYNAQPTRAAAVMKQVDGKKELVRFDFCASTESRYYAAVALGIWLANWETGCQAMRIGGRFEVLTPEARAVRDAPVLPRYVVSWIPAT